MYLSTARGSSLAVNERSMDVRVTSDRPSTWSIPGILQLLEVAP